MKAGGSSLNPAKMGNGEATILGSIAYATITHQNPDGSIGPGLAASWHYVGSGNREFEFTLRKNARFADGTPVNAAAVKSWLDYFNHGSSSLAAALGKLDSVETVGDWTVRLHLGVANPIVPQVLSEAYTWGMVASPGAVAQPATLDTMPAGAGPYKLDQSATVVGDHYVFVPSQNYYDQGAIKFKKVTVRIIPDPATMLQSLKTGQIDVAEGDFTTVGNAQSAGFQVVHAPESTAGLTLLDLAGKTTPALADPRVRQALNYALDRDTITKSLFGNYAQPTSEFVTSDGFDPGFQNYYTYDPEKAKKLLADAGYSHGFSFDAITSSAAGNLGAPLTRVIAKYLSSVGVTLNVRANEATLISDFSSKKYASIYIGQNNPMWLVYQFYFAPMGAFNQHSWADKRLDQMLQAAATMNEGSSQWRDMSRYAVTQGLFLPVATGERLWFVSPHIGGVETSKSAPNPWPAAEWFPR